MMMQILQKSEAGSCALTLFCAIIWLFDDNALYLPNKAVVKWIVVTPQLFDS